MTSTEPPIRKELLIGADPERAFAIFTAEIGTWWPMESHSVGGSEAVEVTIDGRIGGHVVESTRGGDRHVWGTVRVWDPPGRLVMDWHPGRPAGEPTELEIRFEPHTAGSRLVLEHRGWERVAWGSQRASYERGWDPVLARYTEAVEAATTSPISPGPA